MALFLKTIKKEDDLAFIEYEKHPKDVASIFGTQLI